MRIQEYARRQPSTSTKVRKLDRIAKKYARSVGSKAKGMRSIDRRSKIMARSSPAMSDHMRTVNTEWKRKRRASLRGQSCRKRLKMDVLETDRAFEADEALRSCIDAFVAKTSVGPVYVCSVCHQTWFAHSVKNVSVSIRNVDEQNHGCLTGFLSLEDEEWICGTCESSSRQKRIPKLSIKNKMRFPVTPAELADLRPLEERLISPRIPFMQIRELPSGGQLSITFTL